MATKDEYEIAARIVAEVSGNPSVGVVAYLINEIKKLSQPAKEVRVVEPKENR